MGDLKTKRATHISAPIDTGDVEYHLNNNDVRPPKDLKDGKAFYVRVPVVSSSHDKKGHRYKSVGLPDVISRDTKTAVKKMDKSTPFKTKKYTGGY